MVRAPKLTDYVGAAVTVYAINGYVYTGTLAAIDRHMNAVLSACCCRAGERTRTLGLMILRGEEVMFLALDKEVVQVKVPKPGPVQSRQGPKPVKPAKQPQQPAQPVIPAVKTSAPASSTAKPALTIPGLGQPLKSKIKR